MRATGLVDSARGLVPHGHLCWAYEDRGEFRARAADYMAGTTAAGQWIAYVGSGSAEELWDELASLDGLKEVVDGGGIGVLSVDDFVKFAGHSDVVDPVASVAAAVSATEKALAPATRAFVPWSWLLPTTDTSSAGLGLWLAHQMCSDVTLENNDEGFTIRLTAGSPPSRASGTVGSLADQPG